MSLQHFASDCLDFALKALIAAFFYFSPIHALILLITLFVFVDMFFGIWAAAVEDKDVCLKTSFKKSGKKLVVYVLLIAAGYGLEDVVFKGAASISLIFGSYIASTELVSIAVNGGRVLGTDLGSKIKKLLKDAVARKFGDAQTGQAEEEKK